MNPEWDESLAATDEHFHLIDNALSRYRDFVASQMQAIANSVRVSTSGRLELTDGYPGEVRQDLRARLSSTAPSAAVRVWLTAPWGGVPGRVGVGLWAEWHESGTWDLPPEDHVLASWRDANGLTETCDVPPDVRAPERTGRALVWWSTALGDEDRLERVTERVR
ncbi:MAG: hypothetical protein AAF211_32460, partial [Myxococcota bacterium]